MIKQEMNQIRLQQDLFMPRVPQSFHQVIKSAPVMPFMGMIQPNFFPSTVPVHHMMPKSQQYPQIFQPTLPNIPAPAPVPVVSVQSNHTSKVSKNIESSKQTDQNMNHTGTIQKPKIEVMADPLHEIGMKVISTKVTSDKGKKENRCERVQEHQSDVKNLPDISQSSNIKHFLEIGASPQIQM
jgi:hypothetical protein